VPSARGFKVGESLSAVAGDAVSPRSESALAEKVGRAFITNLLDQAATRLADGAAGKSESMSVSDLGGLVDALKKLKEIGDDKDGDDDDEEELLRRLPKRLRRKLRMLEDDDDAPRERRDNSADFMLKLIDRLDAMMERMDKNQRESIRELRSELKGKDSDEDSFWSKQAREILLQRLQSNPVQEYMSMREHFRQELGDVATQDTEGFIARERVRLERERVMSELERAKRDSDDRRAFIEALPSILHRNGNGAGPPSPRGLHRITCGACGHEWLTSDDPRKLETVVCPKCRQETRLGPAGEEKEPPAPAAPAAGLGDEIVT
jgi:HEPN domain-containing protein